MIFGNRPDAYQQACGVINMLYHLILMKKEVSVDKFLTPNNSILDLVKRADEEGFDIEINIKERR